MTNLFSDGVATNALMVVKRSSDYTEDFQLEKIEKAVRAAFGEVGKEIDQHKLTQIALLVKTKILLAGEKCIVSVETIQDLVETTLMEIGCGDVAKAYILYRNKRATLRENRLDPDPNAISDYIHPGKYSRYLEDRQRREVYSETVSRVEDMHVRKFPQVEEDIKEAFDFVRAKKVLPSMRSMQFAGKAIEENHARQFNCSYLLIDKISAFRDTLYLLLCGCGVGYSVQYDHIEQLPSLSYVNEDNVRHYTIADTIEGWANALHTLLMSYVKGYYVEFNYSKIRDKGKPLKTSGGKAPGHLSLKWALEKIRSILDNSQGRQLRPIECYDIICFAADAVLSGGIRRSATIALFSLEDGEMMAAKTGDWMDKHPWRRNSNNSAVLKRGEVHKRQFKRVFKYIKEYGEPGFVFVNDYDHGFNPCQRASAPVITRGGLATFGDISEGDEIWSAEGWTTVVKKWSTGVKPVYRYKTTAGYFEGTATHRVVSGGEKIEVDTAPSIDVLAGPVLKRVEHAPNVVVDGLVVGDGGRHGDFPILNIGAKDHCYFTSEISSFIGKAYGSNRVYKVDTGVQQEELVPLPERRVPKRYMSDPATIASFLRGLYSANGSVVKVSKGGRVVLKATSQGLIEDVQLMLSSIGIRSYYTTNKAKRVEFSNGEYLCKESYDLNISTDRDKFKELVGFIHPYKSAKLEEIIQPKSKHAHAKPKVTYDIVSKEYLGDEEVFDITVDNSSHTYWTGGLNVSNCVEINLNPVLVVDEEVMGIIEQKRESGQFIPKVKLGDRFTGVAFCNLTEINAASFKSPEDFYVAATAAATIGTLQAAYTSFPFLGWVSEIIAEREALLGVSMTGMMDSPSIALNPEYQRKAAELVIEENKEFSKKLGIRPAARTTCVKPAGSTSLELGCVGSGCHAHHAKRYIRRVTANENQPVFQYFRNINPHMCQRKPNGEWVIEFPVQAPDGATVKGDLTALDFLELVRLIQNNWVRPGTARPDSSPGTCHNVSNTVMVEPNEWEEVAEYVWEHQDDFSGISFIPSTGDKDYAFSPMEAITTEADEEKWNNLLRHYVPVDYTKMSEAEDTTDLKGEISCAGGRCEL